MKILLTKDGDTQRGDGVLLDDVADDARAILINELAEYIATDRTTEDGAVPVFRKVMSAIHVVSTDQDADNIPRVGQNVAGDPRPDN